MAVTTQVGVEFTQALVTEPADLVDRSLWGGRLRLLKFTHVQDGAGDATSSVKVARLPPGKVTLLGALCNCTHAWTTASATMDVGWDAYTDGDGDAVVADPNGIDDGIDVDTAGSTAFGSAVTAGLKSFSSQSGVDIRLTSQDVAIADTNTAEGYLVYVTG